MTQERGNRPTCHSPNIAWYDPFVDGALFLILSRNLVRDDDRLAGVAAVERGSLHGAPCWRVLIDQQKRAVLDDHCRVLGENICANVHGLGQGDGGDGKRSLKDE